MLSQIRVNAAPQKQGGTRVPEVVRANTAKPCARQQRLEVPVDDIQGVHCRADSAEHEAVIPPITASCSNIEPWGTFEGLTAYLRRLAQELAQAVGQRLKREMRPTRSG